MTLLRGRRFNDGDIAARTPVAIVNEAFVRRFMQERNALGRRFVFGSPQGDSTRWIEVVGIVRDARRAGLDQEVAPYVFMPFSQGVGGRMQLLIRTEREPLAVVPRVRALLRDIDPQQPLSKVRLLDQDLAKSLAPRRFIMFLLATFAVAALALAAIGIYGVISYMVSRRTREFGLRMALGAQRREVLRLVMAQASRHVAVGLLLGTAGALAAARLLRNQLYGIAGFDQWTQLAVVAVLTLVAGLAVWVPARRATGTDPLLALRHE
jgi:putative ABC transport system permease protein